VNRDILLSLPDDPHSKHLPKKVHVHLPSAKLFVDPVLTLLLSPLQSNDKSIG
jgi:hypothetical protein